MASLVGPCPMKTSPGMKSPASMKVVASLKTSAGMKIFAGLRPFSRTTASAGRCPMVLLAGSFPAAAFAGPHPAVRTARLASGGRRVLRRAVLASAQQSSSGALAKCIASSAEASLQRAVRPLVRAEASASATAELVGAVATLFNTATQGSPEPLGPSWTGKGVNFALASINASSVVLCVRTKSSKEVKEVPCHRTNDVWHVHLEGLPGKDVLYGFRISGEGGWEGGHRWDPSRILLDPYAPLVYGRQYFGKRDEREQFVPKLGSQFWGTFDFASPSFDWGADYRKPNHPFQNLIIYEMPVRCFTADPSSGVPEGERGTYLGVANKVEHLKELGVTAVELLPVFEYDELEFQRLKNPREHMVNVWGYSHINFFSPMSRFAANGTATDGAARDFKEMVRTLHNAGIEVLLDVVYNHTAEGDDKDPYLISWRGIDNSVYYMRDPGQYVQMLNYSGCGNTVSANHPLVMQQIVDSLVHWAVEYHVDGFRFDLASCLCRDGQGNPMQVPPLIRAIAKHPILGKLKLIAEPWDIGLYQVGSFPNWDVWAEWNGKYRDDVRRFLKGDPGMKGAFATRIAGSADLYCTNQRKPYHSINFITAHDGFSMYDMVAYNSKRNFDNGEGNRDGTNDNFSWNCGAEGPGDAGVEALRQRQMRNMLVALMVSQGTPMIVMGDEFAKTHSGNNNWYGHDTPMAWMQWDGDVPDKAALFRFYSELIKFRRSHPLLGVDYFLSKDDITWHEDNWDNPDSRFLAFTIHDKGQGGGSVYAAFNAHSFAVDVTLPGPPKGKKWCRVVDTNLPPPKDFTPGGNKGVDAKYSIQAYSCIVLLAKDCDS